MARVLLVFLAVLCIIPRDFSYQDNPEFQELLDKTLARLAGSGGGNLHGRITAINDAHRQYQNKANKARQDNSRITVEEAIVDNNLEHGIDLFEGDIVLDERDKLLIGENKEAWKRSNAMRDRKGLWATRVIPYAIDSSLNNARSQIKAAIRKLQSASCLRFYELSRLPSNLNYIYYDKQDGCFSRFGIVYWKKTYQTVSIGNGCNNIGTITHETLHALGFFHEQSRFDRDKHVKILWDNISKGRQDQFEQYSHGFLDSLDVPYDYESIMHYGRTTFSANGEPTIVRLSDPNADFGRADDMMSRLDILVLNALYDCTNSPIGHRGFSSWTRWTSCSDKKDCSQDRERFCINAPSESLRKRYCPGANVYGIQKQNRKCARSQCKPIDAGWSYWSKWTDCTVKCGTGARTRTRRCNDPAKPWFGGKPCTGARKQTWKCSMGKCRLGYYDLQFEGSMGRWKASSGMYRWKLYNMYMIPGPKREHTTGKGYYAMARTAYWRQGLKRKASLVSPIMRGGLQCITFYYVIDGASAKALAVRITLQRSKISWYIRYLDRPRNRDWHLGMGQIDAPGENIQLSFEALGNKKNIQGSIAIDDVYFHPGKCQWPKPTAKPTAASCIDTNKKRCSWWAYRGECKKNPTYMLKNCRKSCVCQPVKCKNTHRRCVEWAGKGECKTNPVWMWRNCCTACRGARNNNNDDNNNNNMQEEHSLDVEKLLHSV